MTNLENLDRDELELRKWALEMSLKHGNKLFPVVNRMYEKPNEIMYNAHKIIKLVTIGWDEPIPEYEGDPLNIGNRQ
jgi:hypothetical protein